MSRHLHSACALALLVLAAGTSLPAAAHERTPAQPARHAQAMTVVAVAAASPEFSTLVSAVRAARLVDTLSGPGPFTVFAPTNAAFETLPDGAVEQLVRPSQRATLQRVLTYHVVPGRISRTDVATAVRVGGGTATLTTVQGGRLTAVDAGRGRLRLHDAAGETFWITTTDVAASNGVIHVIDGVMTPH